MKWLPNRRLLRFSLSTLLLVVTGVCIWLGWQVSIVRERQAMIRLVEEREGYVAWYDTEYVDFGLPEPVEVSWIRRLLGDRAVWCVFLEDESARWSPEERQRLQTAFPEMKDDPLGLSQD